MFRLFLYSQRSLKTRVKQAKTIDKYENCNLFAFISCELQNYKINNLGISDLAIRKPFWLPALPLALVLLPAPETGMAPSTCLPPSLCLPPFMWNIIELSPRNNHRGSSQSCPVQSRGQLEEICSQGLTTCLSPADPYMM